MKLPKGFIIVPEIPTEWMFEKFIQVINGTAKNRNGSGNFQEAYAAMMRAAPRPKEPENDQ